MPLLKIMSWNVNSVRLRLGLVAEMTRAYAPDVLCLQETKTEDAFFPRDAILNMGYADVRFAGQKSYNGVAILSRLKLSNVVTEKMAGEGDARHISAFLPCGLEVHNLYVPAGGDVPDARVNPKFAHKLRALEWMRERFGGEQGRCVLAGDFNVAPCERDVWSHAQLANVVSHTEPEVARLNAARLAGGWTDAARAFLPPDVRSYSWWSYRNRDWRTSNRGRRLDHIWCSPDVAGALAGYACFPECRDAVKPGDHVPVMAYFRL
ncbi:MAG: exodeoxyribonuclease III [Rickettsiales bacterium]